LCACCENEFRRGEPPAAILLLKPHLEQLTARNGAVAGVCADCAKLPIDELMAKYTPYLRQVIPDAVFRPDLSSGMQ
jgi:hypothetical protein